MTDVQTDHRCWTTSTTAWCPEYNGPAMVAVHFQARPRQTEHGQSISMRFPVLVVPNNVKDARAFADRVASILNEHWPDGDD